MIDIRLQTPQHYIVHSGVIGMRWGRRRWQYDDGSLTPAGRERYYKWDDRLKLRQRLKLARTLSKKDYQYQLNKKRIIKKPNFLKEESSKLKTEADEMMKAQAEYEKSPTEENKQKLMDKHKIFEQKSELIVSNLLLAQKSVPVKQAIRSDNFAKYVGERAVKQLRDYAFENYSYSFLYDD